MREDRRHSTGDGQCHCRWRTCPDCCQVGEDGREERRRRRRRRKGGRRRNRKGWTRSRRGMRMRMRRMRCGVS
jgi:hypothetical protein